MPEYKKLATDSLDRKMFGSGGKDGVMKRISWVLLFWVFTVVPGLAEAATVFETAGWITGIGGVSYNFTPNQTPYTYKATLTDLIESDDFGFDYLYFSISTSGGTISERVVRDKDAIPSILGRQGSLEFVVDPTKTYFANIFGSGGGRWDSGNFGLLIQSVPIPTSLLLLGSGLAGIVGLRKKLIK